MGEGYQISTSNRPRSPCLTSQKIKAVMKISSAKESSPWAKKRRTCSAFFGYPGQGACALKQAGTGWGRWDRRLVFCVNSKLGRKPEPFFKLLIYFDIPWE
jgi:hypothetical protein